MNKYVLNLFITSAPSFLDMNKLVLVALIAIIIIGCDSKTSNHNNEQEKTQQTIDEQPSAPANQEKQSNQPPELKTQAQQVLQVLKNNQLRKLAEYVHPEQGVLFSPYAHLDPDQDVILSADTIKKLAEQDSTIRWGYEDGSGKPIELTLDKYIQQYVYDASFLEADSISINTTHQFGNSINNLKDVFPQADVVEYYLPGQKEEYGGMDWKALRLVFEQKDNQRYLVGIVHSAWTI